MVLKLIPSSKKEGGGGEQEEEEREEGEEEEEEEPPKTQKTHLLCFMWGTVTWILYARLSYTFLFEPIFTDKELVLESV